MRNSYSAQDSAVATVSEPLHASHDTCVIELAIFFATSPTPNAAAQCSVLRVRFRTIKLFEACSLKHNTISVAAVTSMKAKLKSAVCATAPLATTLFNPPTPFTPNTPHSSRALATQTRHVWTLQL
jgi:hypothetical protein